MTLVRSDVKEQYPSDVVPCNPLLKKLKRSPGSVSSKDDFCGCYSTPLNIFLFYGYGVTKERVNKLNKKDRLS